MELEDLQLQKVRKTLGMVGYGFNFVEEGVYMKYRGHSYSMAVSK